MIVSCKKCGKYLFSVKNLDKEMEIICWHCGFKNLIQPNILKNLKNIMGVK